MLTMQQVNDLATNAEKVKIFAADHERTERRQAERILDLCATVRELRGALEQAQSCQACMGGEMGECHHCNMPSLIEEMLK